MNEREKTRSPWHEGELLVQERAGTREAMSGGGSSFRTFIPSAAAPFLEEQTVAVIASLDAQRRPWASVRVGAPGFISVRDEHIVRIADVVAVSDPLAENLKSSALAGLLVIDLSRRRRVRINGDGRLHADGSLTIHATQFFGNCPQYIQQREAVTQPSTPAPQNRPPSPELSPEQIAWARRADTLFIASANPTSGADASHRGGAPGFVHVESARKLVLPDYNGNGFFNTLGNVAVNPKAGMTVVDFESGNLLLLTGRGSLDWDPARSARFPGAQRLLDFEIDEVRQIDHAIPAGWAFRGYSPFNP
jgi:uncharacterized protein